MQPGFFHYLLRFWFQRSRSPVDLVCACGCFAGSGFAQELPVIPRMSASSSVVLVSGVHGVCTCVHHF
jgi:hypothetical protein